MCVYQKKKKNHVHKKNIREYRKKSGLLRDYTLLQLSDPKKNQDMVKDQKKNQVRISACAMFYTDRNNLFFSVIWY